MAGAIGPGRHGVPAQRRGPGDGWPRQRCASRPSPRSSRALMTMALPCDADRPNRAGGAGDAREPLSKRRPSWPAGPGWGESDELIELVGWLYQHARQPMVVDADALNALAKQPDVLAKPGGPRVLTPHPGEFGRLTGRDTIPTRRARKPGPRVRPANRRGRRAQGTSHGDHRRHSNWRSTRPAIPAWPPAARATC